MEAKFEGKNQYFYGPLLPEMKAVGKRSLEWDLNDWKWDGDLFTARQLNSVPSDCRSRQLFPVDPETPANADTSNNLSSGWEGNRELEKRRRGVIAEGVQMNDENGSLNFNLGDQAYPIMEGEEKSEKKTKITGTTSNRAVCQVEDCRADLSNAKDYHRRHKVCDLHSKASKALVGNVMQRFCQQCSRFHVLQEFDEGKRSCRRRLAGHNKRRRKTHPDATVVNGGSLNEERGSSYLLMSLLRILSNMHSDGSDHTRNQDVLSHLLRNLASMTGTINGRNIASLLEGSQELVKAGTSGAAQNVPNTNSNGPELPRPFGSSIEMDNGLIHQDPPASRVQCEMVPANDMAQKCIPSGSCGVGSSKSPLGLQSSDVLLLRDSSPPQSVAAETSIGRNGLNNIDLNNVYDDVQDHVENPKNSHLPVASGIGSLDHPSWVQCDSLKSSPPQTSRNSDSTSTQSPSSSSGEAQSRTDRIVFKLFGKDPNDFPLVLRSQILNWLSHSPTEIESYIRPGCIILTIYLRLENSAWEELCYNLGSSMRKLLAASNDSFWRTGWVYTRVRHSVAFLYNGQVVLDAPLRLKSQQNCQILCIKPLAVSASASAQFIVKGFNLYLSSTRLLCALEGKYLVQDSCYDLIDGADAATEHHELQHLSFSCHIPNVIGRGFIEVEDNGLSSCSFPFIVAEQEICSEICRLENVIEAAETTDDVQIKTKLMEEKTRALYCIQEMGWLLHRNHMKARLGPMAPVQDGFQFNRFTWLVGFSMDHDWCAVIKKLLDVIFAGVVDTGEYTSVELALLDMGLLHKAVKRNCRPMVELLLKFVPVKASDGGDSEEKQANKSPDRFLFRPDAVGPAGLTPLHVAASMNGSENVLDALTEDPGMVGTEAWKSARDNTGLTPNDYASLRGFYSYIQLVQRKTSKKCGSQHVLDIPGTLVDTNIKQKQSDGHRSSKVSCLQTEKIEIKAMPHHCGLCQRKLAYGGVRRALVYRPAMLSMVAIAAVCVCVALLFKSSPRVNYVFQPFTWESLEYGSI
ncbi:squamosa promoter-binding-like protein 1 [Gastrolobium bilobum]|uniref:squamosa promoter-binding-like protein 1 n=1 Tax=Gastrolobium bilobum TaxID=150636 RepID=UPI002AB2E38D|nr:squamosa promoter-binding-like protein 1 [Gastrolobium bilobum]XP_061361208.1 squamosa promoter-binding-like protein 1 [Gastrolobium bilobum]